MRRAFHISIVFCAVMCILAIALWISARWRWYELWFVTEVDAPGETVMLRRGVECGLHGIYLGWREVHRGFHGGLATRRTPPGWWDIEFRHGSNRNQSQRAAHAGMDFDAQQRLPNPPNFLLQGNDYVFSVQYWQAVLALAFVPTIWIITRILSLRRWSRRLGARLCPACGYDLRATPDRCPECGRPITISNDRSEGGR